MSNHVTTAVPVSEEERQEARERLPYELCYFGGNLRADLVGVAHPAGIEVPAAVQAAAEVLSAWADTVIGQVTAECSADTPAGGERR